MSPEVHLVTICEHDRLPLLKHFLSFYTGKVDSIHVVLQRDEPGDVAMAQAVCSEFGVECIPYFDRYTVEKIRAWMRDYAADRFFRGFLLPIDVDEFIHGDFRRLAEVCEDNAYLYARGFIVDRIADGGEMPEIQSDISLYDQFPWRCEVTKRIAEGCDSKVIMTRWPFWGQTHELGGTAAQNDRVHPEWFCVDHFKWDFTCKDRMVRRAKDLQEQAAWYWEEPVRILDHVKKYGRINIERYLLPNQEEG